MKKRTMFLGMAVALGLLTTTSIPTNAQGVLAGQTYCPEGVVEGDLGISGLSCEGECTLILRRDGSEESWSFTTEPSIIGIKDGGSTDGILRVGDRLVAIDGILITTKEGGRRYATIRPDETVSVRYRRDGRVREATVQAGARCLDPPEPAPLVGRVAPPPPPNEPMPTTGVVVAPRVVVAPSATVATVVEGETVVATGRSRRPSTGLFGTNPPTGKLGIGFSCRECGTRTDVDTGESIWFFSGPLEVTAVTSGGPADDAGIQRGDLIKAIDGSDIDTDEGGLAFTRLTPGERARLTIVDRDGSEHQVSVVPDEGSSRGIGPGRTVPAPTRPSAVAEPPRSMGVPVRRPSEPEPVVAPDREAYPAPVIEPPAGLPVRYSGGVAGVEVEVRGAPVSVSEMRGARTLIINAEGVWVRIVVPRGVGVGVSRRSGGTASGATASGGTASGGTASGVTASGATASRGAATGATTPLAGIGG